MELELKLELELELELKIEFIMCSLNVLNLYAQELDRTSTAPFGTCELLSILKRFSNVTSFDRFNTSRMRIAFVATRRSTF